MFHIATKHQDENFKNELTKNKKKERKDRRKEGRYIHIHTCLFSHQYIHKCEFI